MNKKSLFELPDKFSIFIGHACGAFYCVAILLSIFEVLMRYVFHNPTSWNLEIVMALCGTAWLLSAGAVTQKNRHITVTVLELVMKPNHWRRLQIIAQAIAIFAILGLIWSSWEPAIHSMKNIERSGSAFNPPLPTYLKILLLVSCFIYLLQLFSNLSRLFFLNKENNDGD